MGCSHGLLFAVAALVLVGCASNIPVAIQNPPPENIAIEQVRSDVAKFIGSTVRWGGTIASVENHRDHTLIEIVGRGLNNNGRPDEHDRSAGRFLARMADFLDPAIYEKGRLLTINGTVVEELIRPIGEFTYTFPVVNADNYFLWRPLPPPPRYNYDPFWYYDPWYPYSYPWHHHPYYW